MFNLQDMKPGESGIVAWILGPYEKDIRESYELVENDTVNVIQNFKEGMIISYHGKTLAMDYDFASCIKVLSSESTQK